MTRRRAVRASTVLSEAWRDVATGTSRVCGVAIALTLATVVCLAADAFALDRLVSGAIDFRQSGAATYVLVAEGRVAADACDRLGSVTGIGDAGGLRVARNTLAPERMPSTNLPVFEATPGMVSALAPSGRAGPGVLLAERVAEHLGLEAGDELLAGGEAIAVRGTYAYPDDGRRTGIGYAVLAPTAAVGLVDECRITVWPPSQEHARLLWSTLRDGILDEAEDPRVQQLSTRHGQTFAGGAEHDARVTRFAPIVAGAAAACVGLVAVRRRRLDLSGALHLGCSPSALLAQMLLEALSAVAAAAGLTGAGTVVLLALPVGALDAGAIGRVAASCVLLMACGHLLGVAIATLAVREKHLFRYFRHR